MLPNWLDGTRRCRPDITRSYAFDLEEVSSTDTIQPLQATNVDSARGDRRVVLSHAASFRFYETDPLEELERSVVAQMQPFNVENPSAPTEIKDRLIRFRAEHAEKPTAFLMMKFGETAAHARIVDAIVSALDGLGIKVVRADERQYHSDLFFNILTYMHGADFGIAVFERLESDEFNPNVSLEVGYMLGLRKQVCLLKDSTLTSLHADLVGKLYCNFNPQNPETSIALRLQAWLRDWKEAIGIRLPV